jgi:hypothetical protein
LIAVGVQEADHAAFPTHSWKAPKLSDNFLRLGVKDLIDIKGEVISAGSEYLYEHAKIPVPPQLHLSISYNIAPAKEMPVVPYHP